MTRRTPAQYDWATCSFDETILPASPRRITSPRRQKIQFVVVHHMAMAGYGDAALDACKNAWKTREASAHYGVAGDKNGVGHVRQYVWDGDEAWATANSQGNQAGISIEHANSGGAPGWEVSEATWRTGAKLVAALHHLYGLGRPVDGVTKDHRVVSGTLFKHSDFYATACCGPYLGGKIWAKYVAEAQHQYDLLEGSTEPAPAPRKVTLSDPRINESSGLAFSSIHGDEALTLNDEDGILFTIQPSTGNTVGTYKLPYTLIDPESVRAFGGFYWLLDGGNNTLDRTTMFLYRFPDLGRGNHMLTRDQVARFVLGFPDDIRRDTEALLVDPAGQFSVWTKGSPNGRELFLPDVEDLSTSKVNELRAGKKVGELITDATFTKSGNFRLAVQKRRPGIVAVVDAQLREVHTIVVDKVAQCESITVTPDGSEVLVGSEGAKSPLIRATIPVAYR